PPPGASSPVIFMSSAPLPALPAALLTYCGILVSSAHSFFTAVVTGTPFSKAILSGTVTPAAAASGSETSAATIARRVFFMVCPFPWLSMSAATSAATGSVAKRAAPRKHISSRTLGVLRRAVEDLVPLGLVRREDVRRDLPRHGRIERADPDAAQLGRLLRPPAVDRRPAAAAERALEPRRVQEAAEVAVARDDAEARGRHGRADVERAPGRLAAAAAVAVLDRPDLAVDLVADRAAQAAAAQLRSRARSRHRSSPRNGIPLLSSALRIRARRPQCERCSDAWRRSRSPA